MRCCKWAGRLAQRTVIEDIRRSFHILLTQEVRAKHYSLWRCEFTGGVPHEHMTSSLSAAHFIWGCFPPQYVHSRGHNPHRPRICLPFTISLASVPTKILVYKHLRWNQNIIFKLPIKYIRVFIKYYFIFYLCSNGFVQFIGSTNAVCP